MFVSSPSTCRSVFAGRLAGLSSTLVMWNIGALPSITLSPGVSSPSWCSASSRIASARPARLCSLATVKSHAR